MPKYISGRSKRRPQDQLSDDRYQYLGVDQSEPNLGDPVFPGETPPFGQQYITVSIEGYPGERYWIPNQGGIIPGSISIFDESNLVGAINSITQLNIVGAAVSASGNSVTKATITLADSLTYSFSSGQKITQDGNTAVSGFVFESTTNSGIVTLTTVTGAFNASGELEVNGSGIGRTPASIPTNTTTVGVAATIEVTPEYFSTNTQVVFNNNDEFDGALGLVYQNNSATDSSNVGLASVGIGTTFAKRTLHVDGDIKLTGSIEDYNNSLGNTSDILVKNSSGGIEWIEQNSLNVGAAGTYYEVQFHSGTGTLAGADKLVYRSDLNGGQIGIGSTIPTKLLDVLGDSIFTGDVTFDGDTAGYDALWDRSENAFIVKDNAKFAAGTDSDLEIYHDSTNSYIDNKTGHFYIRNSGSNNDSNIYIQARDGENSIVCNDDAGVYLYYDSDYKAYTDISGFRINGRLYVDHGTSQFHGDVRFDGATTGRDIYFDESENSLIAYDNAQFRVGTGGDVRIYHDATRSYFGIDSGSSGNLTIGGTNTTTGFHTAIHVNYTSSPESGGITTDFVNVELWHTSFPEDINAGTASSDGSKKFETIGVGVSVYDTAYIPNLITVGVATIDKVRIGYNNDNTIDTSDGNLILDSTGGTVKVDDILYVSNDTNSTNKDTGSIYTEGGVGIEKNLNVGGSVGIASTAESTSKDTGALIVEGGVGIEKNLNVGQNIGIAGSLTVIGITTLGVTTLTDVTAQQLNISGITTLGVTTLTDTTSQQLFVSGISTLGNVLIQPIGTGASVGEKEPGVSGVVTFYGDGSGLRNVVAIGTGIDIKNSGTPVGSANTINFGDNLTGSLDDGVYTVNADDAYWIKNNSGIHTLGNVGIGSTLPDKELVVFGDAKFRQSEADFNEFLIIGNGKREWYKPSTYIQNTQVGTGITFNALGTNATRTTDAAVYNYMWNNYDVFDFDGDGVVSPLDTILFIRTQSSFYIGSGLVDDLLDIMPTDATRKDHESIRKHYTKHSITDYSGISYNLSSNIITGITTYDPSGEILSTGISVTGNDIPANTTITAIGTNQITISNTPTNNSVSSSKITVGDGLLDIDGDGRVELNSDAILCVRVFGDTITDILKTAEGAAAHDWGGNSFLNPDDGGTAQFRFNRTVGIGTTLLSTSKALSLDVYGNVDINADLDVDGRVELDTTNISETLNVVGVSTFGSNVDINADLDVDGHTELDDLNVSGVSTFASNVDIDGKVSIADTTSNAGGARYISTEAPTAGVGQEGDIWYDVSSTADVSGTNGNIPIGGIIMWHGTIANIPASWALCDGTSYSTAIGTIVTPDLRDRFVVGAATTLTVNSTDYPATTITGTGTTIGGSKDAVLVSHSHTYVVANNNENTYPVTAAQKANEATSTSTYSTNTEGTGGTNANLPPYYALAYIMRIV